MSLTHATDADLERVRADNLNYQRGLWMASKSPENKRALRGLQDEMAEIVAEQGRRATRMEDIPW